MKIDLLSSATVVDRVVKFVDRNGNCIYWVGDLIPQKQGSTNR